MNTVTIVLIALVLFLGWRILGSTRGVASITSEELKKQIDRREPLIIIDVRQKWEYDQGHIAGARLIPLGSVSSQGGKLPKDKPIVLVCRSGHRSAQAFQMLKRQGYTNLVSLTGGMSGWTGPMAR